jgi:mono/diheme cytochrome c family protein
MPPFGGAAKIGHHWMMERVAVPASGTLFAAVLALTLFGCAGGGGQTGAATREDPRAIDRGRHQFRLSCAGCHGADARGNGPVAPILALPVPDLTRIAARRDGRFPDDEVYRIIDGQADLSAHGPRHMPVWGYEFFGDDPDDEVAHRKASEKIERVLAYLRSIQQAQ